MGGEEWGKGVHKPPRVRSADRCTVVLAAASARPALAVAVCSLGPGRKREHIAEDGFDPSTSGLWAQHASAAPLCCLPGPWLILPLTAVTVSPDDQRTSQGR